MSTAGLLELDLPPFLDRLPAASRKALLAGSTGVRYRAGSVIYGPGDPDQTVVLDSGLGRIFVASADGREATIRYWRPGELAGLILIMRGSYFDGWAQALVQSTGLRLDIANVRRLVEADVAVADVVADELAVRYAHTAQVIALQAFGSVTQQVAADLLERCCARLRSHGEMVTAASQQEIADAVGSVRAVVARSLGELRDRQLIEAQRRYIRILDPEALQALAFSRLG